ncbi:uncharacterized protein EAF01_004012 [Botrytis porri]|uniref:uncharacterized protein n=1 Tax=Botrytis porri TaxID=87229 RepID=UPI0019000167|nr:uncharacterized protein EAF01_004012 [Botrytis porri]KAF7908257.1 hypothetical protein EAF01_004012 [Botrytis porri]
MSSTETLEIVKHQTSIWAVTTRIAVVDAVVSTPVALPSSTEHFRGASNAIERDNDVKDYIRGVRGSSKSIKVDDDGKISPDTIDDLFLNVYPLRKE